MKAKYFGWILILCVAGVVQCDVSNPPCDDGWLHHGDTCYLMNNVKTVSKAAADAECKYHDSSLLDIQSQDVLIYLKYQLQNYPSSGYWTSLTDLSNNVLQSSGTGVWKWGQYRFALPSVITWNTSPSNDGKSKCAGVNIQGRFVDLDCNSRRMYICQARREFGCPLGWLDRSDMCVYMSSVSDLKTWDQAKTHCESMSSIFGDPSQKPTLYVITDNDDRNVLVSELPYVPRTTQLYWTGLVSSTPPQWTWYTHAELDPSLIEWQVEPDDVAGAEHCGVLRMNGAFSDRNCSSGANFICNKPQYSYNASMEVGCGTWLRAGRYCYGFITGKHAGSWSDARKYCQSMGAHLIQVDSADKKGWLEIQLMEPANDRYFWTGLNDRSQEGTYVWADGTAANPDYIKWNQEPNNFKGQENCALVYNTGQYNDVPCLTQAGAICEIDNVGTDVCQPGWVRNGANCYLFTQSNNISLIYNQLEATNLCQSLGGRLLSVNDASEKQFILSALRNRLSDMYGWWTSLNDKQQEGYWAFGMDPVIDPTLIDWDGEPSTRMGDNCGVVSYAGHFFQRNCALHTDFICEKDATDSASGDGNSTGGINDSDSNATQ